MAAPDRESRAKRASQTSSVPSENLALLYQGLFTGIVRVQSRRQHIPDADSFRRRMKTALQEVERDAAALGYESPDVKETHFAVVALLDSVVLNSTEPVRIEWERRPLQEELFGQSEAGVVFFEKLERFLSRRDSSMLADILEVYLLCLLLGFQGRYSGGLRGELHNIQDRVRARIEEIRGRGKRLSPAGLPFAEVNRRAVVERRRFSPYPVIALAALVFTLLCFLALKLHLLWTSDQVYSKLF